MGLDSYQFPCKNYGDLGFRIYGRPLRHLINFLQGLQLLLSVGVIVIGNGQALSQVSVGEPTFSSCFGQYVILSPVKLSLLLETI